MDSADKEPTNVNEQEEFDGRIFIVEGNLVFVEAEMLTKLAELSPFFNTLLFVENDMEVVEFREVDKENFEAFLNVIRFYMLLSAFSDNSIETNQDDYERLDKIKVTLSERHIIAVILLCDTFSASNVIDMTIVVFQYLLNCGMLDLEEINLIRLLEVAFKVKHDVLKEFSANLMRKVSLTMGQKLKGVGINKYYTEYPFNKNTFFYYNAS